MKREIRCPNDNTLLVTIEPGDDGKTGLTHFADLKPRPSPDGKTSEAFAVCPKCGAEVFAYAMRRP